MARMRPVAPTRRLYEFLHLTKHMASNRVIPPGPEQLMPEEAPDSQLAEKELEQRNQRKLNTVLHAGAVAQIIVGATVILAICFIAKLVLVTLLVSILLAFMLEPLVNLLERVRLPRSAGAFVAVLVLVVACWGASYFFYYRAVDFLQQLPRYTQRI